MTAITVKVVAVAVIAHNQKKDGAARNGKREI